MIADLYRTRSLALSVACACLAVALGAQQLAWFPIACAVGAVALGPRLDLDRVAQAGLAIGAMVVGVLVPRLAGGAPQSTSTLEVLSDRALLLVMPMIAVAAARSVVARPIYGARVTLAAVIVALTGAGRAMMGPAYVVLFALALVFGFSALRAEDSVRAAVREMRARHVGSVAFLMLLAAVTTAGLSRALPSLHDALIARMTARWAQSRTGFSDTMQLGALEGMLQNDKVIMRVRGDAPDLLRGVVLVHYAAEQWTGPSMTPPREVVETGLRPAEPWRYVELEHASEPRRYFLPLGATDIIVATGVVQRDVFQTMHPPAGFGAKRVWFLAGDATGPQPRPPDIAELSFPLHLAPALQGLLAKWGVDDQPAAERVAIIEERLRTEYTYSLHFDREPGVDAMLDFLTRKKEGHCEYFASAAALLARASRIPSRVVAGYRVGEVSPFGYRIVRERDAHSWVEVWVDDQWRTVDPTPPSSGLDPARVETPTFAALIDALRTGWEAVDDWLGARTPFELSLILVGLFAALILYRTLRARRGPATGVAQVVDRPLPAFADLLTALEKRGIPLEPSLTALRLARRVAASERVAPSARAEIAEAIERYAALRYGKLGDESEVVERLRSATRAAGG